MSMKDSVVIHHSAVTGNKPQAEGIKAYHKKKFGQAGAYHYLIEKSGLVVQYHVEEFMAYHCGDYKMNERSIGICLAGDFTKEQPTAEQAIALTNLVKDIQLRWGIPDDEIYLHKEIKRTSCPGAVDWRALIRDNYEAMVRRRIDTLTGQMQKPGRPLNAARLGRLSRVLARLKAILGLV